jgi:hypothetical protein
LCRADHHHDHQVHLAMTALAGGPSSWLYSLLLQPRVHAENLLPSMPDNALASLIAVSGYVGW